MSLNLAAENPSVKSEGPKIPRAASATDATQGREKPLSFTQVPHEVLAIANVSDAAKVAWAAIQRWTFAGRQPYNCQLALACGWITPSGEPSITKTKKALRELEAAGLISRVVTNEAGRYVRERLDAHKTIKPKGGQDHAQGWAQSRPGGWAQSRPGGLAQSRPGGGRNHAQGGGRNHAPSEDPGTKTQTPGARSAQDTAASNQPMPATDPTPPTSETSEPAGGGLSSSMRPQTPAAAADPIATGDQEAAKKLIGELLVEGYRLHYEESEAGPRVRVNLMSERIAPLDNYRKAQIRTHKPALLAALKPSPTITVSLALRPRVPAVPAIDQVALLSRIAGLMAASLEDVDRLATDLAVGLRERDPARSRETFAGMFRDVRAGQWPVDILQGAAEVALASTTARPGAILVRQVKDRLRDHRRGVPCPDSLR